MRFEGTSGYVATDDLKTKDYPREVDSIESGHRNRSDSPSR